MPRPTRPLSRRNGLLSVIHIRRKQLGISDPEYRDFLWEHFEVVSAAALEEEGLDELLRCLDRWNRPNAAAGRTRTSGLQGAGSALSKQRRTEVLWRNPETRRRLAQ